MFILSIDLEILRGSEYFFFFLHYLIFFLCLQKIAKELVQLQYPGQLIARKVDLRSEQEILRSFQWIKENLKSVDVMINNAGLVGYAPLTSRYLTGSFF